MPQHPTNAKEKLRTELRLSPGEDDGRSAAIFESEIAEASSTDAAQSQSDAEKGIGMGIVQVRPAKPAYHHHLPISTDGRGVREEPANAKLHVQLVSIAVGLKPAR